MLSILVSFSADADDAMEFERAASELVASGATMVLSEARGQWLFLVIREGICVIAAINSYEEYPSKL